MWCSLGRCRLNLLIILFVKEISTFNNDKTEIYFEKIIKLWVIVYFVVTLDVIFEIIFGQNIFFCTLMNLETNGVKVFFQ